MLKISLDTEMDRILALSEYNLDYPTLCSNFEDLTRLAAKFTGTKVSMVNLLDTYHQWTIGQHGIAVNMTPCEESICYFTVQQNSPFEVKDLKADERFKEFSYVAGENGLRYYYGVPITTHSGHNLGALCLLDYEQKVLTDESSELIQILAREVVNRLNTFKQVELLQARIQKVTGSRRMLAHDIRGPLSGIIGLAQLGIEETPKEHAPESIEYFKMIADSGRSTINLAEDILLADQQEVTNNVLNRDLYSLNILKTRILDLFLPRTLQKGITLTVIIPEDEADVVFTRGPILQIIGNLTGNALKFTPVGGHIDISLNFSGENYSFLLLKVEDDGLGMSDNQKRSILNGTMTSTAGTQGEFGYGLGLTLVKQLIDQQHGTWTIATAENQGCRFDIRLPL